MIRTTSSITANKDGFIFGGSSVSFATIDNAFNRFPLNSTTSSLVGAYFIYDPGVSPHTLWYRHRSFFAFNTSGYKSAGWAETAKLKLSFVDIYSSDEGAQQTQGNYYLNVYTVSGSANRNQPFSSSYGFGVDVSTDPEDDWQLYLTPMDLIARYTFSDHGVAGATQYKLADGSVYRYGPSYVEIPIPLAFLNASGETHLMIVSANDIAGQDPRNLSYPTSNVYEYVSYYNSEASASLRPQMQITYVSPTAYTMGDLRIHDLSVQFDLQQYLNLDPVLSGVLVMDGYPDDSEHHKAFVQPRTITVEHEDTVDEVIEVGRVREINRLFFVDVVCDKRGELDDLTQAVLNRVSKSFPIYDFHYGFINPPQTGRMMTQNFDFTEVDPIVIGDKAKYHNVVTFEGLIVRSGV